MQILSCRDLRKTYALNGHPLTVLDGISLSVDEGEIVVIVGQSGSGKSTLLRILAGLLQPDSGEVEVAGRPLHGPTSQVGILFQNYTVFPWMSVVGNVEAGLLEQGLTRAQRRRVALEYVKLVGLTQFAYARPDTLSGGMQQRVALARTYAMNPLVLLMDEPFGALDALTRREMQNELVRINKEARKAVVFVTHDISEAVLLASRIFVLSVRPATITHVFTKAAAPSAATLYHDVAEALEAVMHRDHGV